MRSNKNAAGSRAISMTNSAAVSRDRHAGRPPQAAHPDTGLKEALGQLAAHTRTLAGDLESVVWTVSPKNNSWDRLATFIDQFALRFFRDTAVECHVEGTECIPAAWLSPEAQHHTLAV